MSQHDIYRTVAGFSALRSDESTGLPILEVTFARFNVWNEINSWEGRFMERLLPGAFTDTFVERAGQIRCLFEHGKDPAIGNKPIGTPTSLRETDIGPVGTVALYDVPYVRDLLPALEAGDLGASYRFGAQKQDWVRRPVRSEWNPEGLPERSIARVGVAEFGPVTFGADPGATSAVRSLDARFGVRPDEVFSLFEDPTAGVPGANEAERARVALAYAIGARRPR